MIPVFQWLTFLMLFALHFSPVYFPALIHNLLLIFVHLYTDVLTNIT